MVGFLTSQVPRTSLLHELKWHPGRASFCSSVAPSLELHILLLLSKHLSAHKVTKVMLLLADAQGDGGVLSCPGPAIMQAHEIT